MRGTHAPPKKNWFKLREHNAMVTTENLIVFAQLESSLHVPCWLSRPLLREGAQLFLFISDPSQLEHGLFSDGDKRGPAKAWANQTDARSMRSSTHLILTKGRSRNARNVPALAFPIMHLLR